MAWPELEAWHSTFLLPPNNLSFEGRIQTLKAMALYMALAVEVFPLIMLFKKHFFHSSSFHALILQKTLIRNKLELKCMH